jgi:hypothetical protein
MKMKMKRKKKMKRRKGRRAPMLETHPALR